MVWADLGTRPALSYADLARLGLIPPHDDTAGVSDPAGPADGAGSAQAAGLEVFAWPAQHMLTSLNQAAPRGRGRAVPPARLARPIRAVPLDGGLAAVRPVLDLPPERRISWVGKRLDRFAGMPRQGAYARSPLAARAYEEIRETFG